MITLQGFLFSCFIGMVVMARTEKDVKAKFIEIGMECNNEHPVTDDEFEMLKNHKIPDTPNAKCLLACTFKKLDWMDNKGMFDDAAAYKMAQHDFPDAPDKVQSARNLYDLCLKVNEATTSDGEKGCERAALLTTCLTGNYEKMGFVL